jgi:hypothetical protein
MVGKTLGGIEKTIASFNRINGFDTPDQADVCYFIAIRTVTSAGRSWPIRFRLSTGTAS